MSEHNDEIADLVERLFTQTLDPIENSMVNDILNDRRVRELALRDTFRSRSNDISYHFTYDSSSSSEDEYQSKSKQISLRYVLCMDLEATCDTGPFLRNSHEVIEMAVILVDLVEGKIVDSFHSFVKPTHAQRLSKFCKDLTGISQHTVSNAPSFRSVMNSLERWIYGHDSILVPRPSQMAHTKSFGADLGLIYQPRNFAWVTHGTADFDRFLCAKSCKINGIRLPVFMCGPYINIKTIFMKRFGLDSGHTSLLMLGKFMDVKFTGHLHSGLDDTRMIVKLMIKLYKRDPEIELDSFIDMDDKLVYYNNKAIQSKRS